jgi:predicted secreted protein
MASVITMTQINGNSKIIYYMVSVFKIIVALFLCILVVSFNSSSRAKGYSAANLDLRSIPMVRRTIRPVESAVEVYCNIGDVLVVRIGAIPGTGYSWIVGNSLTNAIAMTESSRFEPLPQGSLPGGLAEQVLEFRVISEGTSLIRLFYCRPWEICCHPEKIIAIRLLADRSSPK